ncbi:ROK family transcriptional regulator [Limosilactobacillus oris]|uniref:ROK family transcriptional regulator n=1 Tax=Limosilactobacillus oris TaxID=1632 RepID=UPI00195974D5|nr:ROK family transcriptional regulator [Limosilactobacillus oris]VTX55292.1 N-acetylglucosamine repressor [Limosilactobacillus oris]
MSSTNRDLNRLTNLKLVKQQLFNHPAISRAAVARNTGLTRSTTSSLFAELDRQGFVRHLGRGQATENGGRKPELYTINTHYGYIACFNLTYDSLYVMFLYADGQEISFQQIALANHELLQVMEIINQQLATTAAHNDTEHGLLGISFSIHAVVEDNQIVHSPYYPLHGINLQKYYQDRYHVPVKIGNEANLAAIYERDYGKQNSADNFLVLSIHRGPGIGVIANRELFTGYRGMVGELGSVKIPNRQGQVTELGDVFSSDHFLARLGQATGTTINNFTAAQQAVRQHDDATKAVLTDFATVTGQLIFNLQMLYGPEKILINSPLVENIPELGALIQAATIQCGCQVPVIIIKGAQYVSLLGAGALLIRQVLGLEDVALQFQWFRKIG